LPIGMLLIFGFAIRLQIKNIPVAVQDFDRSPCPNRSAPRLRRSSTQVTCER
jgi:ABC-2 type transport system permease protein